MTSSGRKWPKDPNFWLLAGICFYGLLTVASLTLTLLRLVPPNSGVHVAVLIVLPSVGLLVVLCLQFGSYSVRFHPVMLIGCLVIVALSLLVYLQFSRM